MPIVRANGYIIIAISYMIHTLRQMYSVPDRKK